MLQVVFLLIIIIIYFKYLYTENFILNNNSTIVHQIWFQGYHHIPYKLKKNAIYNKNFLKNWNYMLWDEKKIINLLKHNQKWYDNYNSYKHLHQKIDFAKYVILYYYGGIYVDMDAKIIKNPDILLREYPKKEIFLSYIFGNQIEHYLSVGVRKIINNGIIFVKNPKNKIMKEFINLTLKQKWKSYLNFKLLEIQNSTGPKAFTQNFNKLLKKYPNKIKILSYDYFEPCILDNCNITQNTITVHHHTNTWLNDYIKTIAIFYSKIRR